MMIKRKKKYLFFIAGFIACFFSVSFCSAQAPVIKTVVDRNEILIGQQFKLTIDANFSPDNYKTQWLAIPDSLQHFDVIDRSQVDSIYDGNQLIGVTQTITLTSFDSGQWALPAIPINFSSIKNDSVITLYTDSLTINVSYLPPDSTNQLKDIKPIREVNVERPLWQWIVGGILILLLILGIRWLYRHYKKPKVQPLISSKLSPYDQAMQELDALKKYSFSDREELKAYHSKLSDVFKTYLTRKQNIEYREKTTSDILVQLNNALDKQNLSEIASTLRCGDAVKFAKYLPSTEENSNCVNAMKKIIGLLDKNPFQKPV